MSSLKINPVGWRLNVNCSWNGVWYSKSNYSSWYYIESIFKELVVKFFNKFSYLTKEVFFFQNKISIYILILLQKKKKRRLGIKSFFHLPKNRRLLFSKLYLKLKTCIWLRFLNSKSHCNYKGGASIRFFSFYVQYKLNRQASLFSILLRVLGLLVNKYITIWLKNYTRFSGRSLVADYFKSRIKFSKRNRQYRLIRNISTYLSKDNSINTLGISISITRDRFFLSSLKNKSTLAFVMRRLLFNSYPLTSRVVGFKVISKGRSSEIKSRRSVASSFGFGPMGFKSISNRVTYTNALLVGRMGTFNIKFYYLYSGSILDSSYKVNIL